MAKIRPPDPGPFPKGKQPHPHHHQGRHYKGHHGHHKGKHPKGKHLHPRGYHQSGAVAAVEAGASRDPGDDRVNPAVGGGSPDLAREIEAGGLAAQVDGGLLSAVLQLAGTGDLSGHALSTWQREQDRIANRAWRRPGGMQRMGNL